MRTATTQVPARLPGLLLSAAGLTALLAGCQSVRLTPEQEQVRMELARIDPGQDLRTATTEIIDVHTHTFNARYLPLEGVLLGKRDSAPPLSWLLSDNCAKALARALVDHTALSPSDRLPGAGRRLGTARIRSTYHPGFVCTVFLDLLDKAVARGAWDPNLTPAQQFERMQEVAEEMSGIEKAAIRTAGRMMGMDEHLESEAKDGGVQSLVRFLWTITRDDAEMVRLYRMMHGPSARPPIRIVSHMMDLAPVYDQAPDGTALLDFEREQIPRMKRFKQQSGNAMIYFVAYNPYRDSWRGGKDGDALRIVKNAIRKHGATGVKVYPPSGYRPARNRVTARPRTLFTPFPARQWDARYGGLGEADRRDEALDRKLEDLLLWCIKEDIPVFTHGGHGEFEARRGYGAYHSDPAYWRAFLEAHPARDGKPCPLRLCIGHAGGDDYWLGIGKHQEWGREVFKLCTEFPNVYCEITTSGMLLNENTRAVFVDRLADRFRESENLPYGFHRKLVFGTDWYLPDTNRRREVLEATQRAFLHESLKPAFVDYFSGNARRYLNLEVAR